MMKVRTSILASLVFAGAVQGQVYRCQGANGSISYSDVPCLGAIVAPQVRAASPSTTTNAGQSASTAVAPSRATTNSRQARDEFDKISTDISKPEAIRVKKRECDAGNVGACAEWDKLERAHLKFQLEKLEPAAKNVRKHLFIECESGNKNSCENVCPTGESHGDRFDLRFLQNCAKVLERDQGSFWQVTSGHVKSKAPIELKYARKMPKGVILEGELVVVCYRKRISGAQAQIDTFRVKEAYAVDNSSGVVGSHSGLTPFQRTV